MAENVLFYFDFASPYAYLASTQIDALVQRYGRTVDWRPMMLGAALKITGVAPGANIPLRGAYMRHDMQRFARLLGVPITVPAALPINALQPSRAYWFLHAQEPALARRFAEAVFRRHFIEGADPSGAEETASIAASVGADPAAVIAALADPSVKERLRVITDTAVAHGVFGSPFFFVDGEPFWGVDRLNQLEAVLSGHLPANPVVPGLVAHG